MELADIPVLSKYVPLALCIAFVVQGVKNFPYLDKFFAPGPDGSLARPAKAVVLALPFVLGIAAGYLLNSAGDNGDPLIRGICAGGMSTFIYDIYTKLMRKKSDGVDQGPKV